MIKIKKSYSVGKLRRNILHITKNDREFYETAGRPWDMFFHLYDNINAGVKQRTFYNVYSGNTPIAYLCIAKQTKEVLFYVSIDYRSKVIITEIMNFINKKIGSEFYTGTKKTNDRFIRFAHRNNWSVFIEDEKNVIFKALCQ